MRINHIVVVLLTLIYINVTAPKVFAMLTPHPIQLYERGVAALNSYHGDPIQLYAAEKIFSQIIDKYPNSPFGYLGISRIRIIESYRYGNIYDMEKIRQEALPFAIKALELGSSLRDVHEHYAIFEHIFEQYYANQKQAQNDLTSAPEDPQTFFTIATFLNDQNEDKKALDYYKIALDMAPSQKLRLRILKRIILIYLNNHEQPAEEVIPYCEEAIKMENNAPELPEYLGRAYLRMHNYKSAVEKFTESFEKLNTDFSEYYLLQAKGYLASEDGKTTEALSLLEKALAYRQVDVPLHYAIGNLYFKQKDYQQAYQHFQKVIEFTPHGEKVSEPKAYYFAGRSAESLGDKDSAKGYYKHYLELNASSQEAEWIRQNIPDLSRSQNLP